MIPQQGGEWWHAQTQPIQWAVDPQERTRQAMAETDRRLEAHFAEQNPFRTSFDKTATPASFYQQGVAQAHQEFQQQAVAQRAQARDATNQFNSAALANYKTNGQQYYTDPATGRLAPVVDAQGRNLYHATAWEDATHPKTGLPVMQKRDQYGQRQFKDLPVVPGLDPTDDQMYFKKGDGTLAPAGKIADMMASPDYNVARAALSQNTKRIKTVHQRALAPMKELVDATNEQFKNAQDQRDDLNRRIQQTTSLRDQNVDDAAAYAGYDATVNQLTQKLGEVNTQLGPKGELAMTAAGARRHYDIARRQAMLDTYKAQNDEIGARLRSQGKDPATDAAYQSNQQGMQTVQQSLAAANPDAPAQSTTALGAPVAQSPLELSEPANLIKQGQKSIGGVSLQTIAQRFGSGEGPVDPSSLLALNQRVQDIGETLANPKTTASGKLKKSLQDQQDYFSTLYSQRFARLPAEDQERIKKATDAANAQRSQGTLRQFGSAMLDEGGKPLLGAGGQKGELGTIPAVPELPEGMNVNGVPMDVAAGVANVLSRAASGLTSKTNLALLAGTGGAGKLVQRLISGGFGASMLKDAYDRAPEVWKILQDPASTRQQKTEAIGDIAATLIMGGAAAAHAGGLGGKASRGPRTPEQMAAEAELKSKLAEDATSAPPPVEPKTAAEAARETGADRVPRSAEDVAGIFERNMPQTEEPLPPTKSAAEAADTLASAPQMERTGEVAPDTAQEAARTIETNLPQTEVPEPPVKSAAEAAQTLESVSAGEYAPGELRPSTAPEAAQTIAENVPQVVETPPFKSAKESATAIEAELLQRAKASNLTPDEQTHFEQLLKDSRPPEEPGAGAENVSESAKPAPSDADLYKQAQADMISAAKAKDPAALQEAWRRNEEIKNRHEGMPPKENTAPESRAKEAPAAPSVTDEAANRSSAELKANNAGSDLKPVSALTPDEAAKELTDAGIKATPKGVPIADANSAQLKDAVGKLRRGELTAEGVKPGAEAKRASDRLIDALNKAKIDTKDKLFDATGATYATAHNAALDIAILGIKAGRALTDVIKLAVQRLKAKYPSATEEDVARLTKAIHEANGTPESTSKKNSAEKLMEKAGAKFREIKDNASLKDAISSQRDAVDNAAGLTASEVKTEISDAIARKESDPKLAKTADNALRFFIEADDGSPAKLKEMRDKVANSTKVDPKWQTKALDAIDYAIKNGDKLKDAAQRYRRVTGNQLEYEKLLGLPTVEAKNYVPRYQDVDEAGFLEPKGGSGSGASNRKIRTHETMADSLAAGVDPKSLSSLDSLSNRVRSGNTDAGLKAWHQAFFDMKAPDGEPVAVKPEKVERADGTSYFQAPKGYEMKMAKGEPTAIKKEFSRTYDALTEPNWFAKNPVGLAAQELNGFAKSAMLAADTFHLGRLALRSSMLNLSNGKVGARFREGLTVANHSPAEIERMGATGEIPKADVKRLVENKNILYSLVENGYNVGRISDALHQELVQKIPGLGGINKFIFDRFQRGAMADAGVMEFRRMKQANPKMDDATVARNVAKELNVLFGNLGRQGLIKSATGQAIARFAMLAPQWNEGLIRAEIGGVAQTAKFLKDKAAGSDAKMGIRGRAYLTTAASLFVASQLMNLASRGKPTWENPEESADAKMSGWIPDAIGKSSGFFFNPVGITNETSHILMKNFERSGATGVAGKSYDALKGYGRSRESALAHMADTFMTGSDPLGRPVPKDQIWGAIAKSGAPLPISGGSVLRAGKALAAKANGEDVNTEKSPGEFQKQAMQSFGVRTDNAPSPEQRISSLAHEFNVAHGKEEGAPREVSDFSDLNAALRRGNEKDAKDALSDLLEKRSAEDLEKYYRQWQNRTFTGSTKNETRFLQTLNTEQRQQYAKARAERRRIGEAALKAIRQIPAGKRAGPFAPAP